MKKIIILFVLLAFFNVGTVFATAEIEIVDYERNEGLIESLKEDIKELHIYGQPELKRVTLSKGRAGCDFVLEYDRIAFSFLRTWFIQTTTKSIEDCVDAIVHEIGNRTASFVKKELEGLYPIINRHEVKIEFQKGRLFPIATVDKFMVITVLEENDFTFFIFKPDDYDYPAVSVNTVEEIKDWLIDNVPLKKILAEEQFERIEERFTGLPLVKEPKPKQKTTEKNRRQKI